MVFLLNKKKTSRKKLVAQKVCAREHTNLDIYAPFDSAKKLIRVFLALVFLCFVSVNILLIINSTNKKARFVRVGAFYPLLFIAPTGTSELKRVFFNKRIKQKY